MRFTNKIAIVTGGSKGIGLGVVKQLAEEGALVAMISIDDASDLATQINTQLSRQCVTAVQADVSNPEQMASAVSLIVRKYGGLDLLVNSAGIQRYGNVVDTAIETWDEVMNINLKGIFLASKYVIPEMRKRGGGAIVNVSSVQAHTTQQNVAAYTASKGAITSLTRAMAVDHAAENIRVNSVCPASVDTPMLRWAADLFKGDATQEETIRTWGKMHPIGRVGTTQDIASLITFLCSDQAGFITGSDIRADGGLLSALGVSLPDNA
jgi:NAD(P)-dependent dehydrogenase (short-subunit alcohol dehydrogenase family)